MGLTGAKGDNMSVKDLHRRIYFEVLDLIVTQIEHRFCQPGLEGHLKLEQTLQLLDGRRDSTQRRHICEKYGIDESRLSSQLVMLEQIITDTKSV